MSGFVFVASPFSHPSADVRAFRSRAALAYERSLGHAYAPIAAAGEMSEDLPMNHLAWVAINDRLVRLASEVHALKLDGWRDSAGMAHEVALAGRLGIPVVWIEWREDGFVRADAEVAA